MRSMTAPAAVSHVLSSRVVAPPHAPARWLASDRVSRLFALAAAGELVGDKTPVVPPRTDALPLLGRIGSGALVGAAVATARQESAWPAAVVGAVAAGVSSVAMMRLRGALSEALGTDWPAAVAEDVATLALAFQTARVALD